MQVRQVEFEDDDGHRFLAWVSAKWRLSAGANITGKDKRNCKVISVYESLHDTEQLNRDWKVGGLDV